MLADFANIMVQPPTVRCIGVLLKPFSLGHLLILRQMQSAFVTGGARTFSDFIAAAFVCAHGWRENQKLLRSPFRRWLQCRLWALFAGRFNVPVQVQVLQEYINDAREVPEQKAGKPGATRYLHSEWDTRLYKLMRASGFSHIETMDSPLALVNALFIAQLEEDEKATFKVLRDDPITRALSAVLAEEEKKEREGFAA